MSGEAAFGRPISRAPIIPIFHLVAQEMSKYLFDIRVLARGRHLATRVATKEVPTLALVQALGLVFLDTFVMDVSVDIIFISEQHELQARAAADRIATRPALDSFFSSWRFHHKLQPEQLDYADQVVEVESVTFCHGGDELYKLKGVPGLWHEQCLEPALP